MWLVKNEISFRAEVNEHVAWNAVSCSTVQSTEPTK